MAVENLTATSRSPFVLSADQRQFAVAQSGSPTIHSASVEVTAAASATSTYLIARLPTNARLHPQSMLGFDDLASTGSPTVDIGIFNMSGVSDDDDAINDGINVASAASNSTPMIKDVADWGLQLWEIMGETTDPGGLCDIYVTLKDAATNTGGTFSASVVFSVD